MSMEKWIQRRGESALPCLPSRSIDYEVIENKPHEHDTLHPLSSLTIDIR